MTTEKIVARRHGTVVHPARDTIRIRVAELKLSDGSLVYDVLLGNVTLHAINAADAYQLATTIAGAIDALTVDVAEVTP